MKHWKGTTLIEMLSALAIFSVVMTLALSMFLLSQRYYAQGANEADFQEMIQMTIAQLVKDVQESDSRGLYVNAAHNAMVFVSARDSGGVFHTDTNPSDTTYGQPVWQKWICYYLSPQEGTPFYHLIRTEGDPIGSFTSCAAPCTIPPSPIPDETNFQSANLPKTLLAQNLQTFDIEDDDCDTVNLESPLEIQFVLNKSVVGQANVVNPGILNPFAACSKSGYWLPIYFND